MKKTNQLSLFSYLFVFCIGLLPGCISKRQPIVKKIIKTKTKTAPESNKAPKEKNDTLTVWIHGTIFMKGVYHAPPGLCHVSKLPDDAYLKSHAILLEKKDPSRFSLENFYTFGWPGELSFEKREKACARFYTEIKLIMSDYAIKHGVMPKLRILSHSHGGNVAAYLGKIKDQKDLTFSVDELILLACPIQTATVEYLKHPVFKKIYSFYSVTDIAQVGDPQGLYRRHTEKGSLLAERKKRKMTPRVKRQHRPLFSARCFPPQQNAIQARLRIDGRAPYHGEMAGEEVIQYLSIFLDELEPHLNKRLQQKVVDPTIYSLRIVT